MEHKSGIFIQIGPEITKLLLFEIGNFEGWQVRGTVALSHSQQAEYTERLVSLCHSFSRQC